MVFLGLSLLTLISVSVFTWSSLCVSECHLLFLQRQQVLGLGPTITQKGVISIQLHLQGLFFQIRSYSEVLGGHDFVGDTIHSHLLLMLA